MRRRMTTNSYKEDYVLECVRTVREMFYQAGLRKLVLSDGSTVELTPEYMAVKLAE